MNLKVVFPYLITLSSLVFVAVLWKYTNNLSLAGVLTGAAVCLEFAVLRISLGSRKEIVAKNDAKLAQADITMNLLELEEENRKLDLLNGALIEKQKEMAQEIFELSESTSRWERMALTDAMTDISNHRAFRDRLQLETSRAERYSYPMILLLMDVDNFKQYNDCYGHPAGDSLLRRLANVLHETIREGDFVARYGGEEFAVILPQTDIQSGRAVAERLRQAVESFKFELDSITISVGAAEYGLDAWDAMHLTNQADRALIRSKHRGKNRVTFFREIEIPIYSQPLKMAK